MPGPQLVAALKALLQQLGGGTRDAAVSIPAQLALVRRLPMPKLPLKKLRTLMEGQGQQFIPFWRDGATFDLVIVNPNLSPTEQEVLLVAVPTIVVDRIKAALRGAGIRLVAVDVDLMALYRAGVATGTVPAGVPAAVLDVGHRRARIGLFSGGMPTVVRTMDVLPLMPMDVEPPADARFLTPEDFAVETRRTLDIILSQSLPDGAVAATLLSARWQPDTMLQLLRDELQVSGRATPDLKVVACKPEAVKPGFALAFGLALAQTAQPTRLTLLPRPPMDVQKQRRTAALVLVASMLGGGAYGWFWYQRGLQLAADRTRISAAIADHNAYIAKTEKEVAAVESRKRDFDPYQQAMASTIPWSTFYPHLRSLLPTGVVLTNVNVQGVTLNLNGKAEKPEQLADFIKNLHESPMIEPPSLQTFTEQGGAFTISGKLKLSGGGAGK